ncbi:MAG: radical SAM protein [Clostridiales bacterium]|nr:radical SAM protein [Clostridiales bacterium]
MSTGMIFDIIEFAVHDGPGIRKTVFFKGCPLRCNWCHNPESQSFEKEVMVIKGRRSDCGMKYEATALAEELLKGKEILEKSRGGITISGGEPLAQPAFLLELIEALKPVHIALDTSGYAPNRIFKSVTEGVDLVLFDIKHTDPVVHKRVTGVDNRLILENLEYLCSTDKEFYVRIPLIPGINDTMKNMEKIAELIKGARGLTKVDILPYHKTAGAKYPMIGKKYKPLFDIDRSPKVYLEPFKKYNIRSEVM